MRGLGHVTKFPKFSDPLITLERIETVAYLGFHKGGAIHPFPSLPFPLLIPFPPLPSLPSLPSPSLPLPSLPLPLEVGPLIAARGSGEAL